MTFPTASNTKPFVRLAYAILAGCLLLPGQTSTGEIDVFVRDPSGAVIPRAAITITGSTTGNLARTLATNESGLAQAPLLQPETYDVAVAVAGFEKLIQRGISVRVGDIVSLRLTLNPGNVSTEVNVIGQTPLLEEKSITVGHVIEELEIIDLPLNGQNYLQLVALSPNVTDHSYLVAMTFRASGYLLGGLLILGVRVKRSAADHQG